MNHPASFSELLLKDMAYAISSEEKILLENQVKEGIHLTEEEKEDLAIAVLLEANQLKEIQQMVHQWKSADNTPTVSRRIPWLIAAAIGGLLLFAATWWLQSPAIQTQPDRIALQLEAGEVLATKQNLLVLLASREGTSRNIKRSEDDRPQSPLDAAAMAYYFDNFDLAIQELKRTENLGLITSDDSRYLQAMCLLREKRFWDAKRLLEEIESPEWKGEALKTRGLILIQLGKLVEAEHDLIASLQELEEAEQREVEDWLDRLKGFPDKD